MMIIGDLNAQIGTDRNGYEEVMDPFGYGRRNVEGEEVLNLCIRNHLLVENTFFKKQDSHKITRYGWDEKSKTVIDYILTGKIIGGKVRDTKVIPSEHLDSNHKLLVADLNYRMKTLNAVQRMPKIEERRLKEEENTKSFQNLVAQKLLKVLVPKDEHKVTTLEKDYRQKKLQAKRIVKEEKEKSWETFTQKLEQDSKGNQKLVYGLLKSKRSDREDIKAIETEYGDIRDMESIREQMKNYFEILLNGEGGQESDTEVI
ncbi:uncharacterized protein LOC126204282 [Schistocerca nitens]|uniref:uncharacterized protein LOC126204282 n=1 Tax=Schistocerca nitens TaxID=7011 RepID=UPI00211833E9|nr:uncharacterized protein LOC126204282 [Schistocerca nitens]